MTQRPSKERLEEIRARLKASPATSNGYSWPQPDIQDLLDEVDGLLNDLWEETKIANIEMCKLESRVDRLREALEEFRLGHEHAPNLKHIREMGYTYGWCDYCSTKVIFGPGYAEQTLAADDEAAKAEKTCCQKPGVGTESEPK